MTDTIALATRKVNTRDEIELELIEAYQNYILTFYALKKHTQLSRLTLNICDAALDTLHKLQIKYGVSTLVAPFSEKTHAILAQQFEALSVDFDCTAPNAVPIYMKTLRYLIMNTETHCVLRDDDGFQKYDDMFKCSLCNLEHYVKTTPCGKTDTTTNDTNDTNDTSIKLVHLLNMQYNTAHINADNVAIYRQQLIQCYQSYIANYLTSTMEFSESFITYRINYKCDCSTQHNVIKHAGNCGLQYLALGTACNDIIYNLVTKHPITLEVPAVQQPPQFAAVAADFDCTAPDAIATYMATIRALLIYIALEQQAGGDVDFTEYRQQYKCSSCNERHVSKEKCGPWKELIVIDTPNAFHNLRILVSQQYVTAITPSNIVELHTNLIKAVATWLRSCINSTYQFSESYVKYREAYVCKCPLTELGAKGGGRSHPFHKDNCAARHIKQIHAQSDVIYTLMRQHSAKDSTIASSDDASATAVPAVTTAATEQHIVEIKRTYTTAMQQLLSAIDCAITEHALLV